MGKAIRVNLRLNNSNSLHLLFAHFINHKVMISFYLTANYLRTLCTTQLPAYLVIKNCLSWPGYFTI